MNKKSIIPLAITLIAYLACSVYAIISTPFVLDWNIYSHYLISKESFTYNFLFFSIYGKPLFTLITSPFAQAGFFWYRFSTVLLGCLTLFFVYRAAQSLRLKQPVIPVILTAFSTYFFYVNTEGFTESLGALVIIIAFYLFLKKKLITSSLVLSSLILIRSDAIILLFLFGGYLLVKKEYRKIPLLGVSGLLFCLLTFVFLGDFLYYIHDSPNFNSIETSGIYPPGPLSYYVATLFVCLGPLLFFSFQPALKLFKKYYMLIIPALAYIIFQSVILKFGVLGAIAQIRLLGIILPFFGLLGGIGLNQLLDTKKIIPWIFLFSVESVVLGLLIKKEIFWTSPIPLVIISFLWIVIISFQLLRAINNWPIQFTALSLLAVLSLIVTNPYLGVQNAGIIGQDAILKNACDFVKENGLLQRKIISHPPFVFYYLDKTLTGHTYSLEMINTSLNKSDIIIYDSFTGPKEGQIPENYFREHPDRFKRIFSTRQDSRKESQFWVEVYEVIR